ncbi:MULTISPECIES: ester cyclase [Aphanothece]|uniref:nuclear transport factor 2 family protein n=1 Tax=Aphanothece TaxID=1121 RepID=UPI003985546B
MSSNPAAGNRRLARLYYKRVMNLAEIDVIPQIMDEDFVFTIPTHPEVFKGTKGFEEEVTGLHGAFPDVHLDVHHKWCFDDLILGLWRGTGTHTGEKPLSTPRGPLPATGHPFDIQGVSWIRADGTLLRENLANEDTLKIIHDLGVRDFSWLYQAAGASLAGGFQFPYASSGSLSFDSLVPWSRMDHPLLLEPATSSAQIEAFFAAYWSAFENVSIKITHAKRSNEVNAYRWEFTADHVRPFFSLQPCHRPIHHQGVTVCLLDGLGRVVSSYINENLIVLIGQMEAQQGSP